jgi:hypothetical protein
MAVFLSLWSTDHWWPAVVRQMVRGGLQAASEEKTLQELHQTLN